MKLAFTYKIANEKLLKFNLMLQDVRLVREGDCSLGFSIIGGTDHSSIPFGAVQPGIFISHVRFKIYLLIIFSSVSLIGHYGVRVWSVNSV